MISTRHRNVFCQKLNGQALYKLARKGVSVEREPRFIHVSRFDILDVNMPELSFLVSSSKGTTSDFAHDLGEKIGCGAHLNALRRTRVGQFTIEDAHSLTSLKDFSPFKTPLNFSESSRSQPRILSRPMESSRIVKDLAHVGTLPAAFIWPSASLMVFIGGIS